MWSLSYNNNEQLFISQHFLVIGLEKKILVSRFTPWRCINCIFNYNYSQQFTESNLLKTEVPDSQVNSVHVVSLERITGPATLFN